MRSRTAGTEGGGDGSVGGLPVELGRSEVYGHTPRCATLPQAVNDPRAAHRADEGRLTPADHASSARDPSTVTIDGSQPTGFLWDDPRDANEQGCAN
jgi:hypothetical protein